MNRTATAKSEGQVTLKATGGTCLTEAGALGPQAGRKCQWRLGLISPAARAPS